MLKGEAVRGDMEKKGETSIVGDLKYHDYAILICHIDAERFSDLATVPDPASRLLEPSRLFKKKCDQIRGFLEDTISKFAPQSMIGEALEFDQILYNPACFLAFGDNDNIVIVGVDEFEQAAKLSSLVEVPVRQTCLAFCPELDALGLKTEEYENVLCEFHDIYNDPMLAVRRYSTHGLASTEPFFKTKPLLGTCYFKLNGTSVLGPGLLVQEYVYKAMAKRIKRTLQALSDHAEEFRDIIPGAQADIDSFRCLFLDPQGWSDMAVLMFCNNYSVITTVIAALRFLTLGDVYDVSDREAAERTQPDAATLREVIKSFGVHEAIASRANGESTPGSLLGGNHLFLSTYTCLGIYDKAVEERAAPSEKGEYNYTGLVIPDSNLNVCSGHFLDVRKDAIEKEKDASQTEGQSLPVSGDYVWFVLGHNDFVYQQLVDGQRDAANVLSLPQLISQIRRIRGNRSEDLLEVSTVLRIPFPIQTEVMERVKYQEHIDLRRVLEELRERLFTRGSGMFELKKLRENMNLIRLPSPLSTAVEYLYTDFANYLTDPFHFESVLDLFDAFAALYGLVTEVLPSSLRSRLLAELEQTLGRQALADGKIEQELFRREQPHLQAFLANEPLLRSRLDSTCRGFLGTEDLDDLAVLTDAMQNSLANRVQITFREAERWNATVDARGTGLDRIISAADAPMKCAFGMLKRLMNRLAAAESPDRVAADIASDNKTCIGGASKISFHPRSFSQRVVVGDSPSVFLASVDLNIAHLMRPRAFYIHLHEVAHLVCDLLRDRHICQHAEYRCARMDKCCHKKREFAGDEHNAVYLERYREVFAEMLVHQLVFKDHPKLFLRNYLSSYALDPVSCGRDDDETFLRMLEVSIRGFLASDPFCRPELYEDPADVLTTKMEEETFEVFWKRIADAGSFVWDFERLWRGPRQDEVRKYVRHEFSRAYEEACHPLCCMFRDVRWIHDILSEAVYPDPDDIEDHGAVSGLLTRIEEAFDDGRPVIRVKYKDQRPDRTNGEQVGLDPLFLICTLLRLHIDRLFGEDDAESKLLYLPRRTNGQPDENGLPKNKEWSHRVLDRNFNGIAAAEPEVRRKSVRDRIVIIKMLWDISTDLRARRLNAILRACWPDLFQSHST